MIVIVHDRKQVVDMYSITPKKEEIEYDINEPISSVFFKIASLKPRVYIIWVYKNYEQFLNIDKLKYIFHHKLIMASYSISEQYEISNRIGYIEQSPFTNIYKKSSYPTWLMSSDIGGVNAEVINKIYHKSFKLEKFDYILNSIAKLSMPKGLFCYSEPLLINNSKLEEHSQVKKSTRVLFKFVRQHYKFIWTINLFLCFILFERKIPLMSFINSLLFKRIYLNKDFNSIYVNSTRNSTIQEEFDVIIPTLGRKDCLHNVLKDFSKQTILPKNIIIVEQNPDKASKTELDYVKDEKWPFLINHIFIHKTGVCNARNLALSKVTSPWVLLGDDDNRFSSSLIEDFFEHIKKYQCLVVTSRYIKPNEKPLYFHITQTRIFGSGNSMLKSSLLKHVKFDMGYEFGYAEDLDFGMQLRKKGCDVIFCPNVEITHLKAPIGGFRTKQKQLWDSEKFQPKPSPTQMLFVKKHYNKFQARGYKFILFIKFYKKTRIKNPFKYINYMNKRWNTSNFWAENLLKK